MRHKKSNHIIYTPNYYRAGGAEAGAIPQEKFSYQEASRKATKESDVFVPISQSALSGVLTGFGALSIYWLGIELDWLPVLSGGVVAAAFSALVFSVTLYRWYALLRESRELLWRREEFENRDIDGDGAVGKPIEKIKLEVFVKDENGKADRGAMETLPISADKFRLFARMVNGGRGLSYGAYTGKAGIFSRSEYSALLDFLRRAGMVVWINPDAKNQGSELTRAGRAALARYATNQ